MFSQKLFKTNFIFHKEFTGLNK